MTCFQCLLKMEVKSSPPGSIVAMKDNLNWRADHECLSDQSGSAGAMEPISAV